MEEKREMTIKYQLPEINPAQYPLFEKLVKHILGDKQDVWALVQAGERNQAKEASAINNHIDQQLNRLREVMGYPEPEKLNNDWWK